MNENVASHRNMWGIRSFLLLITAALFALRITGPSDLEGYAQHRNVGYVQDAVHNGNWAGQYDARGRFTSKPPLHTWFAAAFSMAYGEINRFTLGLPSALAVFALACLIHSAGTRMFGERSGLIAALTFLLSSYTAKQVALVRTDAMFAFFVAAAALCAFQAWSSSARWTRFWCFSALSTLTKGPLGVVLAANGLLASVWQARSGKPMPIRGRHLRGICIFALLTMGWFGLAFTRFGHELVDKMIWSELFGHATGAGKAALPLVEGYKPPLYFLSRFAPWSVFACIGLWRVLKRPATHRDERAFERFLVCWFGIGLLLFSCAAHHRADLLYPLVPPAALLAGREIDRLLAGWKAGSFRLAVATASLAVVSLAYCNYHLFPRYTPQLQQIELAVDGDDEGGESSTVNVENWM